MTVVNFFKKSPADTKQMCRLTLVDNEMQQKQ